MSRKAVSFRLDALAEEDQKIINDWLNKQRNIQLSLPSLLIHSIQKTGNRDVMSYEAQRILYEDTLLSQSRIASQNVTPVVEQHPIVDVIEEETPSTPTKVIQKAEPTPIEKESIVSENNEEIIDTEGEVKHTLVEQVPKNTLNNEPPAAIEKPKSNNPIPEPKYDEFN